MISSTNLVISLTKKKNQENVSNCNYYDLNKIKPLNKLNNKSSLSLFHLNTCSLSKNFEDLEYFDVIVISETRIRKNKAQMNHIDLTNYSYEHFPTESQLVVLFYILNIIFLIKEGLI